MATLNSDRGAWTHRGPRWAFLKREFIGLAEMIKRCVIVVVALLSIGDAMADLRSAAPTIFDKQGKTLASARDLQIAREAVRDICSSLVYDPQRNRASAELIDDLTRALEIRDYRVRYFAVRSLALIGPGAASALPSLRTLLEAERNPPVGAIMMGVSPVPRLENAIDIIEGRTTSLKPAVSDECTNPGVIE